MVFKLLSCLEFVYVNNDLKEMKVMFQFGSLYF